MISVIIPAYNEEASIGKNLDEIIKVLKKHNLYKNSEIIVVNDGSTDKTYEEAKEKVINAITSKKAYNKFLEFVACQKGDISHLPKSNKIYEWNRF